MKKSLLFFVLFFSFYFQCQASTANIIGISFISSEQTVSPGIISDKLTIQTQNNSGLSELIDETADLTLSVDSNTGQFNSNNTSWNPTNIFTMSKNTANKNFYYQDITPGIYTIKAVLKTRISGKEWQATQKIIIGNIVTDPGSSSTSTVATSTDVSNSTSTNVVITSTTTSTNVNNISTHYIQEVISVYVQPTTFDLTAGRDRLGYIGVPLSFEAKAKLSKDLKKNHCLYNWSFGDGSAEKGDKVQHVYDYIGTYNLVLNGDCDGNQAVSRIRIQILKPNLTFDLLPDSSVQINNLGLAEINLYTFYLKSGHNEYYFPIDTIIDSGSSIIISNKYLNFDQQDTLSLIDYSKDELWTKNRVAGFSAVTDIPESELKQFIDTYQRLTMPLPILN